MPARPLRTRYSGGTDTPSLRAASATQWHRLILFDRCPAINRFYPRTCGGTDWRYFISQNLMGLSPHMRGNPMQQVFDNGMFRSIPAHAGEPASRRSGSRRSGVYPPHMRGNRRDVDCYQPLDGSIPAHAGEPLAFVPAAPCREVYPRTCGGTAVESPLGTYQTGLSPHMRGNQVGHLGVGEVHGSIPAHAGEPRRSWLRGVLARVYPRTCGGTSGTEAGLLPRLGLSPHMRGNPGGVGSGESWLGSIPAHAGEPSLAHADLRRAEVYPRTCGGTDTDPPQDLPVLGLSPHMRGNRNQHGSNARKLRSIPAHAGEPVCVASFFRLAPEVYPRTCGGTDQVDWEYATAYGLSPHMRGNQGIRFVGIDADRSIPAHAGEPTDRKPSLLFPGVYPRTCGGTF